MTKMKKMALSPFSYARKAKTAIKKLKTLIKMTIGVNNLEKMKITPNAKTIKMKPIQNSGLSKKKMGWGLPIQTTSSGLTGTSETDMRLSKRYPHFEQKTLESSSML